MNKKFVFAGVAVMTLNGAAIAAAPSWAKKGDMVDKCGQVAAKGMNDCGANGHSCANQAKVDRDPKEWVYTPKGLCKKIGGKVISSKKI